MAFTCPFCSHEGMPITQKQISATGWILFVLLLLLCLPLFWIPFVVDGCKEEIKRCSACGTKLG